MENMSIAKIIKKELSVLAYSIGVFSFKKITKEKLILEVVSNGVAALVAIFIYRLLHSFFEVDSNLKYGVKKIFAPNKIRATEISQKDFDWVMDWIGDPIIFIISLFVFSIVEQIIETYMQNRRL